MRPTWTAMLAMRRRYRAPVCASSAIDGPAAGTDAQGAGSAERRPVLQAALGPQRVETAHDLQRRTLADVAFENFAVIADVLDDAIDPVVGEPERLAVLTLGAEHPPGLRIVGFQFVVDVGLGHAELLGVNHGEMRPAHNVGPLTVAMADRRGERLLGDDFRQHDVVARYGELLPFAVEARRIGGVGIAASGLVGLARLVCGGQ